MYYVNTNSTTTALNCSCQSLKITCGCYTNSTFAWSSNDVYWIDEAWDPPRPTRQRIQKPPPAYILPCLPAIRAQLTPWKGRDYMLRRKV